MHDNVIMSCANFVNSFVLKSEKIAHENNINNTFVFDCNVDYYYIISFSVQIFNSFR